MKLLRVAAWVRAVGGFHWSRLEFRALQFIGSAAKSLAAHTAQLQLLYRCRFKRLQPFAQFLFHPNAYDFNQTRLLSG